MPNSENSIPSPSLKKLSNNSYQINTPCRRVGLKRKSTGTPIQTNFLKKSKTNITSEISKCLEFNENTTKIETEVKDKLIPKLNYNMKAIQKSILNKQQKIVELKSELKNSEQHNLSNIQELSEKWLRVCQEALMSLFHLINQKQNSICHTVEDFIAELAAKKKVAGYQHR
ncbi:Hypothetical protein CINCED_3A011029 [Cinara cedri]|uniref:Meiosis protein 5 homolog n=1 Tax=Cinara cedri TaxID=506608 RepID=A0A5E4N6Q3_9HEMI|nr:Hypothetical protein CINCED_3A011029 [Cinara cedri]